MSSEKIPFSGGVVELRGNSSQTITLDSNAPVAVKWEPLDRISLDVEVRAAIQQYPGLSNQAIMPAPWVRFQTSIGHGRSIWDEPPSKFVRDNFGFGHDAVPGNKEISWPIMPGRGLCHRVTAREFTIAFKNCGWYGGEYTFRDENGGLEEVDVGGGVMIPTFPKITLTVSIQPVYGLDTALSYRYAHWDLRDHDKRVIAFPAGAREFRIFDLSGRQIEEKQPPDGWMDPWVTSDAFPTRLTYVDQLGATVGTGDDTPVAYIESEEWSPIPLFAWGFMVNRNSTSEVIATTAEQFTVEFR